MWATSESQSGDEKNLGFPKPQVVAHLLRKVHITFLSEYDGVWHQSL